jgi:predicted RNA methylase
MKIAADVLAVLETAQATPAGIKLAGRLDRGLYARVSMTLEASGWTWSRKAQAHTHPHAGAADALESLLSVGEVVTVKDLGFFRTQGAALERLMGLADVRPGMHALEPSAGLGDIVHALLAADAACVTCIETHAPFCAELKKIAGYPRLLVANVDFMAIPAPAAPALVDRIVMNPPFGKRADLDHVEHAVSFLKPGGRLAAVMSAGVTFRQDRRTRDFHDAVAAHSPTWIDLPPGSFRSAGTDVNTVILTLERAA